TALEEQLRYWEQNLKGAAVLDLPTDRPRPARQSYQGAIEPFFWPASLLDALRRLSRSQDSTLYMTLLAAFQVLLGRYCGQRDVSVGTPIANRRQPEVEGLIGFFSNTLVLRSDLSGRPGFLKFLSRVRETALAAFAHQDVPFEQVVEAVQPQRALNLSPLFQVFFALQNASQTHQEAAQPDWEEPAAVSAHTLTAKFDLTVSIAEGQSGLGIGVEYSRDLFDLATVRRLMRHFRTLLDGIIAHPQRGIWELPLLPDSERWQLLGEWNAASGVGAQASGFRLQASLDELFQEQAVRRPAAVAVVGEGPEGQDEVQLSYGDLSHRVRQLAASLRRKGVGPEVRVGLFEKPSQEAVLGILGILEAGGAYLPMDPAYPARRLEFMLRDAGASLLLTSKTLSGRLPRGDGEFEALFLDSLGPAGSGPFALQPYGQGAPEKAAYVIYTSGSTGQPKGVTVSHRNVIRLFEAARPWFQFDQDDVWTLFHSCAFDFSVWEMWGALLQGGRLVTVPYPISRSPADFSQLIRRQQVTVLNQTPSAFRGLQAEGGRRAEGIRSQESGIRKKGEESSQFAVGSSGMEPGTRNLEQSVVSCQLSVVSSEKESGASPSLQPHSLTASQPSSPSPESVGSWQLAVGSSGKESGASAAAPLQPHSLTASQPSSPTCSLQPTAYSLPSLRTLIFGGEALDFSSLQPWFECFGDRRPRLVNMYGITETTVHVSCRPISALDVDERLGSRVGVPLNGWQILLLDREMQPVPMGIAAEICVGGQGVARGYLRRPGLTAERFIPDPFSGESGARLYRSGDLARWRPGRDLEVLGRIDLQVKLRGFRIELGEIESCLEQHPQLDQAAVLVRDYGPQDRRLVAYVVGKEQGTGNREQGRRKGEEKAIEAERLRAFLIEKLPGYMVPSVFVRMDSLPLTPNGKLDRKRLPGPDGERVAGADCLPPRDAAEWQLARIWQGLLGLDRVGVEDDFFRLGGHSLLAVQLMDRIEQSTGCKLPLGALFQDASLQHLAQLVRQGGSVSVPCLVALKPEGRRPPLVLVHPAGGSVFGYLPLARCLDPDQPLYALQSPGLESDSQGQPCDRVEEMAALYLRELRTLRPQGPYSLGGHSLGGLVAFEMARRLVDQGQEVAMLALIDTLPPGQYQSELPDQAVLAATLGRQLGLSPDLLQGRDDPLQALLQAGRQAGVIPPDMGLNRLKSLYRLFEAHVRAAQRYRPPPSPLSVQLLRAKQTTASAWDASAWNEFAACGVEIHPIPGDHFSMLQDPNVEEVKRVLEDWMSRQDAKTAK
ncbi:MAG: alpha/beta fold hydrolase, partial [Acidobacteriota bacterium]